MFYDFKSVEKFRDVLKSQNATRADWRLLRIWKRRVEVRELDRIINGPVNTVAKWEGVFEVFSPDRLYFLECNIRSLQYMSPYVIYLVLNLVYRRHWRNNSRG